MVTINNPTAADDEAIALARQQGWQVIGQLEKGEEGTPHYQLMVRTPQVRFSQVKRSFPRAHIEVTRNVVAGAKYVTKADTRVAALPTNQEMYPSLSKFWDLVVGHIDADNWYTIAAWQGLEEWNERKAGGPLPTPDLALTAAVNELIADGYHIESIAVNPQVISAWRKYHLGLIRRVYKERKAALETEESVSVPMVNDAPQVPSPPPPPPPPPPPGWKGPGDKSA